MLKNYIKLAWRNLKSDKGFSLLNIVSLTIGLTFGLLLFYYVKDELSFDNYHENGDRIFQVNTTFQEPDKIQLTAITGDAMASALMNDFPEVEKAVRYIPIHDKKLLKYEGNEELVDKIFFADSSEFEVFGFEFLEGDKNTALYEPNSAVLTKSTALKFFKDPSEAIGKSLKSDDGKVLKITGITEDVPDNSHFKFNILISSSSVSPEDFGGWENYNTYTYVLLHKNVDAGNLEKKLSGIYDNYQKEIFEPMGVKMVYSLQPLKNIHLNPDVAYQPEASGSMSYVYIFSIIAILLILIACINYMNLTTARSARRAKEIGIRKVAGSVQSQLISQFLTESMLLALISFVLSLCLILLLLPTFNSISGKDFGITSVLEPQTLFNTLAIVAFVGFLGGSYPAFVLSRFNPLTVLKGKLSKASSNVTLRQGLVITQFTISIVMIIATWIIYDQLNFLRNKDLGYDKEQMLVLNFPRLQGSTSGKVDFIRNESLKNPNIKAVSSSYFTPASDGRNYNLIEVESDNGFDVLGIDNFGIDEYFLKNYAIKILEGRDFDLQDHPDSSNKVIINMAFAKQMGWTPQQAIGKKVRYQGTEDILTVMGVMKDFQMRSIYNQIEPLMLVYTHENRRMQFKIKASETKETVAAIKEIYTEVFPGQPMQYSFADQDFNAQLEGDQVRGTLFSTFAGLTIVLAFLGLLGLVAYTTQQRKKEIAIRKVMGAEGIQIVLLVSKNFMLLVAIACLIAFPIAYYFSNKWLATFTYKTQIHGIAFLASAGLVLLLTILTVSYHSIRAAMTNLAIVMRAE